MRHSRFFFAALLTLVFASFALPKHALAGGFYLTDRGVRPMAQGGAFVAGATGAEALYYNPAGLADSGRSVRLEGMATFLRASFTRIDDGGNVRPTVELDQPILPIPLVGYTDNFGLEHATFGISVFAPNSQTYKWPRDGAQRYSLVSTADSLIAHIALGGAFHMKGFSVGLAPMLIAGRFRTDTVFSASDGVTCVQPENPGCDAPSTVDLNPFFAATFNVGLSYDFGLVKLGASYTHKHTIKGDAKIDVTLPDSPVFDDAYVDGDTVQLNVPFPWILRFGVEVRPFENLRTELAFVMEGWSVHDKIGVTPKNIWMRQLFGIDDYKLSSIDLQRGGENTYSVRVGGEYFFDTLPLIARLGLSYDTSAFDKNVLTPLTLDSDKVVLGLGLTWQATDTLELDLTYGHVFLMDQKVRDSVIEQPTAIRPAPLDKNFIANGDYKMEADYLGLGLTWRPGAGRETER